MIAKYINYQAQNNIENVPKNVFSVAIYLCGQLTPD